MQKVIFVLTTLDAHASHRVDDFVNHGLDVQVYSFVRSNEKQNVQAPWSLEIIGSFENSLPYHKRLSILYKGIKRVAKKHKDEQGLCFYYLGLDIAMIATYVIKHPYMYEECDLNHTYIRSGILRYLFEKLDLHIIKKSFQTIFTSEGFFEYHGLGEKDNITLIANKLPAGIKPYYKQKERVADLAHLNFGFAGSVRYENIVSFAGVIARHFPNHHFHFYGNVQECVRQQADTLQDYPNIHFHGPFRSPQDLPGIYSQLDFTLATYDTRFENVRYAEPNKIYEAIFFRTPIIVSRDTFLCRKVEAMKLGFALSALDEGEVISFVRSIDASVMSKAVRDISSVPLDVSIENTEDFFRKLKG